MISASSDGNDEAEQGKERQKHHECEHVAQLR